MYNLSNTVDVIIFDRGPLREKYDGQTYLMDVLKPTALILFGSKWTNRTTLNMQNVMYPMSRKDEDIVARKRSLQDEQKDTRKKEK